MVGTPRPSKEMLDNAQTNTTYTLLDEGDVIMLDHQLTDSFLQTDLSLNEASLQIHRQHHEEETSSDFKDIVVEHGLPPIQPIDYTFDDLSEDEQEFMSRSFRLFARCARVKINRMLKLGGIHKKTNIGCGCIETTTFQLMFQDMEGAKFFHSDRKIKRHGIRYKVPCIGYRFSNHLPVLDLFENWGSQVITSSTNVQETSLVTEYLLQVEKISFLLDTETNEVSMHFQYASTIKYDDEINFHYF